VTREIRRRKGKIFGRHEAVDPDSPPIQYAVDGGKGTGPAGIVIAGYTPGR